MITNQPGRPIRRVIALLALATLVAGCSGTVSQPAASAAPTASASGTAIELPDGFPIGAWSTTITSEDLRAVDRAELAKIGMSEEDLVKENAGTFTTTFAADGTWTTVQKTDQPVKWPIFRGTFTPVGTDGFDQATSFPTDFAGDVVRFKWRVEDGLLHLAVPDPPDPILGVITEAHPWSPAT